MSAEDRRDQQLSPSEPEPPPSFEHSGVVIEARVGTQGCIGRICRRDRHGFRPGLRFDGFLGGNLRGRFEFGMGAGGGTLHPRLGRNNNILALHGLDPEQLQKALDARTAGLFPIDLSTLTAHEATTRVLQAGPSIRFHLLARGRVGAFVGVGLGYHRLRSRCETERGKVGFDFHGLTVPVEARVSAYLLQNLALGMQLDYRWAWYGLAVLRYPQQQLMMTLPLSVLDAAARGQGVDFRRQLPQLWTLTLSLRARM